MNEGEADFTQPAATNEQATIALPDGQTDNAIVPEDGQPKAPEVVVETPKAPPKLKSRALMSAEEIRAARKGKEIFVDTTGDEVAETALSTEEKTDTPYSKITDLTKDSTFDYKPGVYGQLMMMLTYNVIDTVDRANELAQMDLDNLKQQPEFAMMHVRSEADNSQRPDNMGADYVLEKTKEIQDLQKEFTGLSPADALQRIQSAEAKKIAEEAVKSAAAKLEPGTELSPDDEKKIQEAAQVEAKTRTEKFFAAASMMMGEYVTASIADSDFATFLDNFFGSAVSRGNSWSRYRENFADKGKDGEMISQGQVFDHFKSKQHLVRTLNLFYNPNYSYGNKNAEPVDKIKGKLTKPTILLEELQADQMSDEEIRIVMQDLAKKLKEDKDGGEREVFDHFEKAVLISMGKSPESAMIDDRVGLELIQIGHPDKKTAFDLFAKNYS